MSAKVDAVLMANGIRPQENHLEQHGVKGMKWGVRKRRGSTPSNPSQPKAKSAPAKQAPTKVPNSFKNKPQNRRMSDAELRNRLNRLQMEKQYKELTASPKGKSFVKEVLQDTGKQVARQALQTAGKVALQMALEAAAGKSSKGAASFVGQMAAVGAAKKPKIKP